MVSISTPSTGAIIGFIVLALAVGIGVGFAPEIKSRILSAKRSVAGR